MKTQQIGTSTLTCSRLAYGCMRITGTWVPSEVDEASIAKAHRAVLAAVDCGYTLFDHADIYGRGACEEVFGQLLDQRSSLRDHMIIATKCGVRFADDPAPGAPHRYDLSAEHILRSCEMSLKRLRTDRIDIYQLHRPDLLLDPHDVAGALEKLRKQGKALGFGVSNFSPTFVSMLQASMPFELLVNQVQVHLGHLDCFYDGTLDQCIEHKITPLAWSPLGGGMLGEGGNIRENHPRRQALLGLLKELDAVAARRNESRTVIALAWLLKHPSGMIPIVGSADPSHIADAARADHVELDREDWYRLLVAARGEKLP